MQYITGGRYQGKSLLNVFRAAKWLTENRTKEIDCNPYFAKILQELFPHIIIKEDKIYKIASFPACNR